jgi:hypothetical protein
MIWLLPYLGYALAASAVAGAAGYAAVAHFSVLQRVLAMSLDRALRKLTLDEEGGPPRYRVEHTPTGEAAGAGRRQYRPLPAGQGPCARRQRGCPQAWSPWDAAIIPQQCRRL